MPKQNQHEKPLDDILTGQECATGVQKSAVAMNKSVLTFQALENLFR
jgi:hypothetical protein